MNFKSFAVAAAVAFAAIIPGSAPAEAATSCYGDKYYVSCTHSEYDYQSGKYVTCYGSGTPGYVNWRCNSY